MKESTETDPMDIEKEQEKSPAVQFLPPNTSRLDVKHQSSSKLRHWIRGGSNIVAITPKIDVTYSRSQTLPLAWRLGLTSRIYMDEFPKRIHYSQVLSPGRLSQIERRHSLWKNSAFIHPTNHGKHKVHIFLDETKRTWSISKSHPSWRNNNTRLASLLFPLNWSRSSQ